MLVLTRKLGQQIRIGDNITLTIVKTQGNTVRIGIEAPKTVRVLRAELPPLACAEQQSAVEDATTRSLRSTATRTSIQSEDRRQTAAASTKCSTRPQAAHPDRWSVANMRARTPLTDPNQHGEPLGKPVAARGSTCRSQSAVS